MNSSPRGTVDAWNDRFFDGRLTESRLKHFDDLASFDEAVQQFLEDVFARVHSLGIDADDVSELFAWELGFLMPRVLPSAWGGMVPPITLEGRHEKIDELIAATQWRPLGADDRILDIGCGFPPATTVDLARRFPDNEIVGIDPQFARWIVYDVRGDYCAFKEDGEIRYFQAAQGDYDLFDELLAGGEATRAHYRSILDELLPELDGATGFATVERDGRRLVQDPIEEYAGDKLSFVRGGFGDDHLPGPFDVIRSMNVLIYFDGAFRQGVEEWIVSQLTEGGIFVCGMNWTRSEYSRYSVFRKEDGRLVHKEFAIGLEAVRPLEMVPFFSVHGDEKETEMAMDLVRILRADDDFMARFTARMDDVQAREQLCVRGPDGHLGGIEDGVGFADLEPRLVAFMNAANEQEMHEAAASVLRAAGFECWRNEVGDTAVAPKAS